MKQENNDSKICPICGKPTHKESEYCIFHASAKEKTIKEFKPELKKYIKKIKKKDNDYDFEKFIFVGDINFKKDLNVTIFKNADFSEATFKGDADFSKATFKGGVGFGKATFKGVADFSEATFKGINFFFHVTFKVRAEFGKATFEENAEFGDATFEGYAGFREVTFERYVHFGKVTFKGNANFQEVTFKKNVDFKEVTFKENVDFSEATFEEDADFKKATFEGNVDFSEATFEGSDDFVKVRFKIDAYFWGTTFKGNANFQEVTFKKDANFQEVTFKNDAFFRLKYFVKILNFSKIKAFSGKKLFIKSNYERGKISFERAYLENVYLNIELNEAVLIDFYDALARNTKIERDQIENHVLQEKKKEFSRAKKVYMLLKNNFHSIGQYEDESWAFKKEKDMERFSHSYPYYLVKWKREVKKENFPFLKWLRKKNFRKWIISAFSNIIYGYGEKPWNVVIAAGALIIIFAYFFTLIGIGNPEIIKFQGKIHPIPGTDMRLVSEGILQNTKIMQFSNSLYFSLITFTTLGYGDFRPLEGWGRILAGSEAFIGAFMMALFVYTFARRTGGR